ncbi:MAG: hypothetical protein ACYSSI_07230 [Planctomycetota bacterium]|jgi:hypothetical protein
MKKDVYIKVTVGVLIVFCLVVIFKLVLPTKQEELNSTRVEPEVQETITKVLPDRPRPDAKRIMASSKSKGGTVEKPPFPPKSKASSVIIQKSVEDKVDASQEGPVRDVRWEQQRASSLLKVVRLHYRRAQRDPKYYKTMVEFSRKIFKELPDSEEAVQARELLKNMPEEYLKKYGVTDK